MTEPGDPVQDDQTESRHRWSLHIGLFALTAVTTTLAGVALDNEIAFAWVFFEPLLLVWEQPRALHRLCPQGIVTPTTFDSVDTQ